MTHKWVEGGLPSSGMNMRRPVQLPLGQRIPILKSLSQAPRLSNPLKRRFAAKQGFGKEGGVFRW